MVLNLIRCEVIISSYFTVIISTLKYNIIEKSQDFFEIFLPKLILTMLNIVTAQINQNYNKLH